MVVWPGMCHSVTPSNFNLLDSLSNRRLAALAQDGIPMRIIGLHFANPSSPLMSIIKMFLVTVIADEHRARVSVLDGKFRYHDGFSSI